MNLRRWLIHAYLHLPYAFHKATGTGAFGRRQAVYLDGAIDGSGNPLKTALLKHYVKQFHESSCSVASVVAVLNAIREVQGNRAPPLSQMDLLDTVRTAHWKERMSDQGYNGRRGLPLPVLGQVVKSTLDTFQVQYTLLEIIAASQKHTQSQRIRKVLRQRLNDFETQGDTLIIAHFDQGVYVPALNIPHISPVGGFDQTSGDVIVLDVDTYQPGPYKVTFDTFYKGISSNYHHILRLFGYRCGGYVYIRLG